ncbi:MAG: hypothetical protein HYZ28_06935 [Myxococcales bacterium]|nr:hypothetical protein [Myxococcales bacterium]
MCRSWPAFRGALLCPAAFLAVACGPPGASLSSLPEKAMVVSQRAGAWQLALEYDPGPSGCSPIGGAKAKQDDKELKLIDRGGARDGACVFPSWSAQALPPTTAFVTFRLEDGNGKLVATFRNLFAERAVALKSPASLKARVGEWVQFEYLPDTDSLFEPEVRFVGDGQPEPGTTWLSPLFGQAQLERNRILVAVPGRQGPAMGRLFFSASARSEVFACEGPSSCRSDGVRYELSSAFEVLP